MGVSGQELTSRAYTQAQKFGADVQVAGGGSRLICADRKYAVEMASGERVLARAVIVATGAEYRKLLFPTCLNSKARASTTLRPRWRRSVR